MARKNAPSIVGSAPGWTLVAALVIAGGTLVAHRVADHGAGVAHRPISLVPLEVPARRLVDVASWYGRWHDGRPTASGEPFDMTALTAAHRSLPLGACVEVTNLGNGRRVLVRVNDRGPYVAGRTIDLSLRAAEELGMVDVGLARVRIRRTAICVTTPDGRGGGGRPVSSVEAALVPVPF
jgi:rare lipoprotein A